MLPHKDLNKTFLENELPIHFFTIVLNGKPFIDYHIEVFQKLKCDWHWHIVEGVADLKHDSSWVLKYGGQINEKIHRNGLSNDGTTEYLNGLVSKYPDNVTIYRKENGFWSGKVEMVNKPLDRIKVECLLWQIDVDELWNSHQIMKTRKLFSENPERTAAYFFCNYFVGERRVIVTENTYGNHLEYEWLRVWRYKPGDIWTSHAPPKLTREIKKGHFRDLHEIKVFTQYETKLHELVFQHYAYVTEKQLEFKEVYYGYSNAVANWKKLNSSTLPIRLKDYFHWVKDKAIVDDLGKLGIEPIAYTKAGSWNFDYNTSNSTAKTFLSAEDYNLEAEFEILRKNYVRARELLSLSIYLDEKNIKCLNNTAVLQILEYNLDSASLLLNGILALDPGNYIAHSNIKSISNIKVFDSTIARLRNIKPLNCSKFYKLQINFDLNDGCNLNCIMCGNVPNKNFKNQNVMPWGVFENNIAGVFKYANDFQFGCYYEPLMVPYFEQAVWALRKFLPCNVKGNVITNGMLLKDSKIEAIIDSDIFKKVRFSIDSISESLFEKIRVGGHLKLLLKNIQKVVEYRNLKNSKSLVEVNFTIMKENISELPNLIYLAKEIGIDSITTHKLAPQESIYVEPEKQQLYHENIRLAQEIARENKILFHDQIYNNHSDSVEMINGQCGYKKKNYILLTIDYNGNINHGCKNYKFPLGNLKENSFDEMLRMDKYKNMIATLENANYTNCSDCGMFTSKNI